jgi:hypothetical protein
MGRRYPIPFVKTGGSDKATQALGAFVVGAVLLAAVLFVAVTLMRGTRADRSERYVPGPGPMLDPEVPIKLPKSWDKFYAFF